MSSPGSGKTTLLARTLEALQGRLRVGVIEGEGMAHWLFANGANVLIAHVNPNHYASVGVARRVGLNPTAVLVDGEMLWSTA